MTFSKTFAQLLEVTHVRAFIMGVLFLILGHLLPATSLSGPWKIGLLVAGFVASITEY